MLLSRVFCRTSPKAAKVLLTRCVREAEEYAKVAEIYHSNNQSNPHRWVYEFLLATLEFQNVSQVANSIHNYANHHKHQHLQLLAMILNQSLPMDEISTDSDQISILCLVTQIAQCLQKGEILPAREILPKIHSKLESETFVWPSSYIDFFIDDTSKISIKWMSINQLYLLIYLISGFCYISDSTSGRASRFLQEGLRITGDFKHQERCVLEYLESQKWINNITKDMKYYLIATYLSRSRLSKAERILQSTEDDQTGFLGILKGMYLQKRGDLKKAEVHYRETAKNFSFRTDTFIISTLNLINILEDSAAASRCLESIEPLCNKHEKKIFKLWLLVLKVIREGPQVHQSNVLPRVIQQSSEYANTQLQYISLTALSERFGKLEHAEKMAISALELAKKSKDELWCLISGRILEGIINEHEGILSLFTFFTVYLQSINFILDFYRSVQKYDKMRQQALENSAYSKLIEDTYSFV